MQRVWSELRRGERKRPRPGNRVSNITTNKVAITYSIINPVFPARTYKSASKLLFSIDQNAHLESFYENDVKTNYY